MVLYGFTPKSGTQRCEIKCGLLQPTRTIPGWFSYRNNKTHLPIQKHDIFLKLELYNFNFSLLIAKIKTLMNFKTLKDNGKVTLLIEGNIDTTTAGITLENVKEAMSHADSFVIDLAGVEYISSAGLRVLLIALKTMTAKNGTLVVSHVCEDIMEILRITGLADILTFE